MRFMFKKEYVHHVDLEIHQNADPMNGQKDIKSTSIFLLFSLNFSYLS